MDKNSVSKAEEKSPTKPLVKPITAPPEVIRVAGDIDEVVCDGGLDSLGHPQVWYSFDGQPEVCCFYCGRRFIQDTEN